MDIAFAATLLAVIEEGSIVGGAQRMGLTPGAVSLRIKGLERELRTPLIARAGRGIVPTAAARRLVGPLSEIVAKTKDLVRLATERQTPTGELRLGAIATAGTGTLPSLVATLMHDYPGIDLIIEPGTSNELSARVLEGGLDAAILVEPTTALRKDEVFVPWFEEPLVMIVPPDTPGSDPLALIASRPFIRYDRRSRGGMLVDDWLRSRRLSVCGRIELDVLDGIVAMVAAGVGISIIPDWNGPRPAGTEVKTIALPAPVPRRRMGLHHKRVTSRQDLVDLLTPTFRKAYHHDVGPRDIN